MNQPTAKPTEGAQGSENSKTPMTVEPTEADADIKALGALLSPEGFGLCNRIARRNYEARRRLQIDLNESREATGHWMKRAEWAEKREATLRQQLAQVEKERDQARQDLEERCAENDRERAAHLQAYQEACKERDAARAQEQRVRDMALAQWGEMRDAHQKTIDSLTAAESELAELRLDRKRLRGALQFVADWNLPQVESRGELVPYAVAYGSNGERDYMRHIARAAIDATRQSSSRATHQQGEGL